MSTWFLQHGIPILIIIIISAFLFYLLKHFIPSVISRTVTHRVKKGTSISVGKRIHTLTSAAVGGGTVLIVIMAGMTILAELGVNVIPTLASLGVVGLVMIFGFQNVIKDMFSGVFILLENQYSVSDLITISGVQGRVEEVSLRRTVIRDFEGNKHIIPNGEVRVITYHKEE